jgi:2-phospho-L-lactate transferase/gluconeogenesis factor (CofD/UPF0052 family)
MDEFGQLPFGDLRQALVALARGSALADVFTLPVEKTNGTAAEEERGIELSPGASLGQRPELPAIARQPDHLRAEINEATCSRHWRLRNVDTAGKVLPVTLPPTLCAELEDGQIICGETEIDTRGKWQGGDLSPIEDLPNRETPS